MRHWIAAAAIALLTLTFAASAQAAKFDDIVIASNEDAVTSETTFAKDTPELFLSADLSDAPAGTKVTVSWISVDSSGVAPPNYKIDRARLHHQERGRRDLHPDQADQWLAGRHLPRRPLGRSHGARFDRFQVK